MLGWLVGSSRISTRLGPAALWFPCAALALSCRASLDLDDYGFAGGSAGETHAMGGDGGTPDGGSGGSESDGGGGGSESSGGSSGSESSGGSSGSETDADSGVTPDASEPIAGNCTVCDPIVLAPLAQGVALTALSPLLYYVDGVADLEGAFSNGKLMRMSNTGGTATELTFGVVDPQLSDILADGAYIYSKQYTVGRTSILGGYDFTAIDGAPSYVISIRTNSTHVFALWSLTQMYVTRIPKEGGTATTPATTPLNNWIDFDVDEAFAYVATTTTVSRAPLGGDGSEATVVAAASASEVFDSITIGDADRLLLASDQRLASVEKSGGTPALLSAGAVYAMTSDGTYAYFMRARPEGGDTCSTGSDLYSVPVAGGTVRHLATDLGTCTTKLVQDANGVYWIAGDGLSILKALE